MTAKPKDPTPPPPPQSKRATPKASPEFAQARIRRDIRVLDERKARLDAIHEAKTTIIVFKRAALANELAAVEAALTPPDRDGRGAG